MVGYNPCNATNMQSASIGGTFRRLYFAFRRRGDRILRYNLSVAYEHVSESRSQHSGPVLDCSGGQVSSNW